MSPTTFIFTEDKGLKKMGYVPFKLQQGPKVKPPTKYQIPLVINSKRSKPIFPCRGCGASSVANNKCLYCGNDR